MKSSCKNKFWGFSAQFIPVRTNNFRNFVCDFFIPAITQSALKVDSICFGKIFTRCVELLVDCMTLPCRVLTVIPRFIYNLYYPKQKDPFYQYLKAQGLSENVLSSDAVYVRFEWVKNFNGAPQQFTQECSVGFIALPKFLKYYLKSFEVKGI